jgi:hypothetical protein
MGVVEQGKRVRQIAARSARFTRRPAFPGWSKTEKQDPSAQIDLVSGGRGRFVESAIELIREMKSAGHSMGAGFLFRPLTKQRDGFEDAPLSAAALRKRV